MITVKNPEAFDETPELGMGYHFGVVRESEKNRDLEGVIVLNGQFAITATETNDARFVERLLRIQREDILLFDQGITIISAPPLAPERAIDPSEDIALLKRFFGHLISNLSSYEARRKLHASPPFPLATKSPENVVRFSAFRNDRRIRPDGSLLPGSYVTSELDAGFAPSGFAVVGRYALPNPLAAINRFDILVPTGTPGLVGTVAPAFGQAGGGIEIELTKGTPPGSVKRHSKIPEY